MFREAQEQLAQATSRAVTVGLHDALERSLEDNQTAEISSRRIPAWALILRHSIPGEFASAGRAPPAAAAGWFVAIPTAPHNARHNACRCIEYPRGLPIGGPVAHTWPRTVDTQHPECRRPTDMSSFPPYVCPSNTNLCRQKRRSLDTAPQHDSILGLRHCCGHTKVGPPTGCNDAPLG